MASNMTPLERFKKICSFELVDDPLIWSVDSWNETFYRWVSEGMPVKNLDNKKEINGHLLGQEEQNEGIIPKAAIGGVGKNNNPPWIVAVDPMFELKVISEDENHVVEVDYDGAIVKRMKNRDATIPHYLEYPVKDKKSWDEYKKRLDPSTPGRWPAGWEIMTEDKTTFFLKPEHAGKHWKYRDFPLGMNLLSLFGNLRQYMGIENLSYAIFDNMSLVEEMMEWQVYIALEMLKKVFATGVTLEWVWLWEDMAYNKASLVSPSFVKKYMVPRYKRVVEVLKENKVDALILDCDGNIDELMPIWVDCGINAIYPIERAAGMDPLKMRKQFGKNLVIIGGIDKRELAKGKSEIDRQVQMVKELIKYSGYMVNCDHHITPDISYQNIVYFINEVRKLNKWDKNPRKIIPGEKNW
jgi:hypothetical protein